MRSLLAWLKFRKHGVPVSFRHVLGMSLQRVLKREVVDAIITAHRNQLEPKAEDLELHALAGGHPLEMAEALVFAKEKNLAVGWQALCTIDFAGHSPRQLVEAYSEAISKNPSMTFDEMMREFFRFRREKAEQEK